MQEQKQEQEQKKGNLFVADIMTRNVVFVEPETEIIEVARLLFTNRFHGIPVTRDGKLVGIITEKDFFTKKTHLYLPSYIEFLQKNVTTDDVSLEKNAEIQQLINTHAKDIMTVDCVTILQDMKISDLIGFFKVTRFSTLPVTDLAGKMVGVVTLGDILNLLKV